MVKFPPGLEIDSTASYGKYLVNSVANCRGCHTQRDLMSGAFIGPDLAGGFPFEVFNDNGEILKGKHLVSQNLTPDSKTGIIAQWDQDTFIKRFRTGVLIPGSPMPWGPFSRMSDWNLKRYTTIRTYPINLEQPYGIQEGDPGV